VEFWITNQYTDTRDVVKVASEDITLGRDESCDVTLHSQFVSRRHARIFKEGPTFFIEAVGVSGVVVANHDIPYKHRIKLNFGDEIRLGEFSVYMMEPTARRLGGAKEVISPRKRVVELEQQIHAELLDRLNLRVTGQAGAADQRHVALVKHHLAEIIERMRPKIDSEMALHLVQEFLWRNIVTEVSRRVTGRLMYSYGFEDTDVLDTKLEETITRMIGDVISYYPLRFRIQTLKEDVATIEAEWPERVQALQAQITPALRDYIVRRMISKEIEDVVLGYGPLQDLLEMPNVNEIMVIGKDKIYIEKDGELQNTGRSFFSNMIVQSVIERIITPIGRRIDRSTPLVDARLPDGSRVNAIINPLSLSGPTLTIRKFARIPFTIDDLIEFGTLEPGTAEFLRACVLGRKNIMIAGGTGSGKTTTLNVLSNFIPADERIVTIEDSAELQLPQEHLVSLETRPPNIEGRGEYTIRDLVKNALRMRPDRLIVGECRGPEALDMLQAMNTGHDGSLSTIHANTPQDTMMRVETMVLMAVEMPVRAIREQIVAALDLVVQIARLPNGERKITHISEVVGIDPDTSQVITEDIFLIRSIRSGEEEDLELRHTGYIPRFADQLISHGFLGIEAFT